MADGRLILPIVGAFLLGTCFGLWLPPAAPPPPQLLDYAENFCARAIADSPATIGWSAGAGTVNINVSCARGFHTETVPNHPADPPKDETE